ncbi:MAG TPA: type II secretion system F family protein [Paraburkholderia sp.]|jgi:Flp pilus assembly protein TadB|nr:type II secretion system F family protein [Paraburkholderia sp.]
MTVADLVAVCAFFSFVFIGLLIRLVRQTIRSRAPGRIKDRLGRLTPLGAEESISGERSATVYKAQVSQRTLKAWLLARMDRLQTVTGNKGVRQVTITILAMLATSLLIIHVSPLPGWSMPFAAALLSGVATVIVYRRMTDRYRTRFLMSFPDTLDLIVRAVRAGVPVGQAIMTAANEAAEPVRTEFRIMGDSLKLGVDMGEVLEVAVKRVQLPDFSFFSVCLTLQRETGGQLGETLENLSAIIRTRREVRLKTKALTAEARVASKIIAAVPFSIMGFLYLIDAGYVLVLFRDPTGRLMLTVAGGLLVVGLTIISRMANLDTSR